MKQQKTTTVLPEQHELEQSAQPTPKKRKMWFVLVGIFVLVLIQFLVWFFVSKWAEKDQSSDFPLVVDDQGNVVTPTPMPFYEMTIPALRERMYTSSLDELEVYSQNPSYTSYLTSYDSDGLRIDGLLTKPTGEMPVGGFPAIVFLHGYIPPTQYQTTQNYVSYVDFLTRNGFVVFKIDLRGHDDSEGEASGAYYSSDYIVDTLNAYEALASSDFVNPEKIGLWGHSMAGNVVMRSLAAKPEIPAIVVWAGAVYSYTDWAKYGIDDNSYRPPSTSANRTRRRQELLDTHGQPSTTSAFWQQVAPTNYLSDITGAIQLNHAVNDSVVDVGYSRDLNALLDETSVVHEFNEYAGGGHNIDGAYFSQAMNNTVEFFKKYLE